MNRGPQFDIYDTFEWWSACLPGLDAGLESGRVEVVFDGQVPVLILPLRKSRLGAWKGAGFHSACAIGQLC